MVGLHSEALDLFSTLLDLKTEDSNVYFNYLAISWQGGIKSDKYILDEIARN